MFSYFQFFAILWTIAHQDPLYLGIFRQEDWNGLPFLSPGDLPDAEIKPVSPAFQEDSLHAESLGKYIYIYVGFEIQPVNPKGNQS